MTTVPGMIEIVDIATIAGGKELLTAYGARGITRENDRPLLSSRLLAVGAAKPGTWRASRGTAEALVAADRAWFVATGKRIRLLDAARDVSVQGTARLKYEAWIAAGSPDPKSARFHPESMKAAFVGKVNESNHQWGGANDWDVHGMCETDAELSKLWDVVDEFGFMPIIGKPSLAMSECWHFDHLGAIGKVRAGFKGMPETRGDAYTRTAEVGCLLAGQFFGKDNMAKYTQARLMFAALQLMVSLENVTIPLPGVIDGVLGKRSIACAKELGISVPDGDVRAQDILNQLDEKKLGHEQIARL